LDGRLEVSESKLNFQSNGKIEELAVRFNDGVVLQVSIDNPDTFPLGTLVTSAPFRRVVKAFIVKFNLLDPGKSTIVKAPL
jgi:hypothetical protein